MGLPARQHGFDKLAAGQTLQVRTLVDVPAGKTLTVSYVPLYDPRPARRDNLRQQRGLAACGCERCAVPIEQSNDRFLEVSGAVGDE